jgi:hypothetical protein
MTTAGRVSVIVPFLNAERFIEEAIESVLAQTAKVCAHAAVVGYDHCWDRYRQHPSSATATARSRRGEEAARCPFLTWLIRYLSEHEVDGEICSALRRQRFRYAHPRLERIVRRVGRGA